MLLFDISTYTDTIKLWVRQIDQSEVFALFSVFKYAFAPVIFFLEKLYLFQIDFSTINLTCNGALAPAELFINLMILFAVVIIICADYPLLLSQAVAKANFSFFVWMSNKCLSVNSLGRLVAFVILSLGSFTLWLFAQVNPLNSAMQYMMTVVTITSFVQTDGHHPITTACDNVSTAPNIDSALAYLATIVAYVLIGE